MIQQTETIGIAEGSELRLRVNKFWGATTILIDGQAYDAKQNYSSGTTDITIDGSEFSAGSHVVTISLSYWNGNDGINFEVTGHTDPPYIKANRKKVESIRLQKSNDWTAKRNDLPKTTKDSDGNELPLYYEAVETDCSQSSDVSYFNNDIQTGSITVTNAKSAKYILPETGGTGSVGVVAAGAAIAAGAAAALGWRKKKRQV